MIEQCYSNLVLTPGTTKRIFPVLGNIQLTSNINLMDSVSAKFAHGDKQINQIISVSQYLSLEVSERKKNLGNISYHLTSIWLSQSVSNLTLVAKILTSLSLYHSISAQRHQIGNFFIQETFSKYPILSCLSQSVPNLTLLAKILTTLSVYHSISAQRHQIGNVFFQ